MEGAGWASGPGQQGLASPWQPLKRPRRGQEPLPSPAVHGADCQFLIPLVFQVKVRGRAGLLTLNLGGGPGSGTGRAEARLPALTVRAGQASSLWGLRSPIWTQGFPQNEAGLRVRCDRRGLTFRLAPFLHLRGARGSVRPGKGRIL